MKYTLTSAQANKLLKKLNDEKALALSDERMSRVFNAAMGEDVESVRPAYSYDDTRKAVDAADKKIRALKHALNYFNVTQEVKGTGMTIDQVLVYIPQLTDKRNLLYSMQNRLPKQRADMNLLNMGNRVLDYEYANYSIEQAQEDYTAVSETLRDMQTALDLVNSTVTFEVELPD